TPAQAFDRSRCRASDSASAPGEIVIVVQGAPSISVAGGSIVRTDTRVVIPVGLPTGTVTLLFSDIEGSTRLVQRLGENEYAAVLSKCRGLLRAAVAEY